MDGKYIIGIDLGGTKIAGAVSDREGNLLYGTTVKTMADEGPEAVIKRIKDLISSLMKKGNLHSKDVSGIGIGSPGVLDTKNGVIINAANLPGFDNTCITGIIEDEFNIKTYLENDANAAALGEYWFGAGKGAENLLYVTVSTGIGGGIVINGQVYSGSTTNAGEIGHITIEPNGQRCNCGNIGCLETLSSGTAIARIAKERILKGEDSSLKSYDSFTSREVFEAAASGDRLASEVIKQCLEYLGIGIANFVTLFDPDRVVIGGGVSKSGEIVFDRVRSVVKTRCLKKVSSHVEIIPAGLGADAGVIGAIGVVLSKTQEV